MKTMAVAPVKNGKVDTTKIVIAYARTNFDDHLDVKTDAQIIVAGNMQLDPSKLLDSTDSSCLLVNRQVIMAEIV